MNSPYDSFISRYLAIAFFLILVSNCLPVYAQVQNPPKTPAECCDLYRKDESKFNECIRPYCESKGSPGIEQCIAECKKAGTDELTCAKICAGLGTAACAKWAFMGCSLTTSKPNDHAPY